MTKVNNHNLHRKQKYKDHFLKIKDKLRNGNTNKNKRMK